MQGPWSEGDGNRELKGSEPGRRGGRGGARGGGGVGIGVEGNFENQVAEQDTWELGTVGVGEPDKGRVGKGEGDSNSGAQLLGTRVKRGWLGR